MATDAPEKTTAEIRADLAKALRSHLRSESLQEAFDELVGGLEDELTETKDKWQGTSDEDAETIAEMERVLTTVRYWLHDILVLQKPISPCPRQILREVEGVL